MLGYVLNDAPEVLPNRLDRPCHVILYFITGFNASIYGIAQHHCVLRHPPCRLVAIELLQGGKGSRHCQIGF